jgi:hypothetical protein
VARDRWHDWRCSGTNNSQIETTCNRGVGTARLTKEVSLRATASRRVVCAEHVQQLGSCRVGGTSEALGSRKATDRSSRKRGAKARTGKRGE